MILYLCPGLWPGAQWLTCHPDCLSPPEAQRWNCLWSPGVRVGHTFLPGTIAFYWHWLLSLLVLTETKNFQFLSALITATAENSTEFPQKLRIELTIWPSNRSSGYLPPNFENLYVQRYVHPVFFAVLFTVAKTRDEFKKGLAKEDTVHIYSGILFSHKKRWNIASYDNMDKPGEYRAKRNKSIRKS